MSYSRSNDKSRRLVVGHFNHGLQLQNCFVADEDLLLAYFCHSYVCESLKIP